ncbi:MAG: RNA methyltransferase [Alphaproteobacteria bacterium]|nr:RNA methyltransferase [Alphaproteobacteria bacterium]MBV8548113.1 RNA methyltransferase [Alphaproteobacteria bacterium]
MARQFTESKDGSNINKTHKQAQSTRPPRGYFGVGVQGISKGFNLGNLVRTSHAFGASFFFTVGASVSYADVKSTDTSHADIHLPFYAYDNLADMALPKDCALVGVELLDEAVDLPSFRHPLRAAYVLGPEKGNLSPDLVKRCDHIVKIPAKFCVNVGIAGALVIYDRMISLGSFAERPVRVGRQKA